MRGSGDQVQGPDRCLFGCFHTLNLAIMNGPVLKPVGPKILADPDAIDMSLPIPLKGIRPDGFRGDLEYPTNGQHQPARNMQVIQAGIWSGAAFRVHALILDREGIRIKVACFQQIGKCTFFSLIY